MQKLRTPSTFRLPVFFLGTVDRNGRSITPSKITYLIIFHDLLIKFINRLNKKRQYEEDDPKRNDAGNGSNERFHDDRGGAYGRDNNRGGYGGYGGRGNNFRSGYNRGYDRGGYNRGGYNNRDRDELHTRDEERKSFVSYPGKR